MNVTPQTLSYSPERKPHPSPSFLTAIGAVVVSVGAMRRSYTRLEDPVLTFCELVEKEKTRV